MRPTTEVKTSLTGKKQTNKKQKQNKQKKTLKKKKRAEKWQSVCWDYCYSHTRNLPQSAAVRSDGLCLSKRVCQLLVVFSQFPARWNYNWLSGPLISRSARAVPYPSVYNRPVRPGPVRPSPTTARYGWVCGRIVNRGEGVKSKWSDFLKYLSRRVAR